MLYRRIWLPVEFTFARFQIFAQLKPFIAGAGVSTNRVVTNMRTSRNILWTLIYIYRKRLKLIKFYNKPVVLSSCLFLSLYSKSCFIDIYRHAHALYYRYMPPTVSICESGPELGKERSEGERGQIIALSNELWRFLTVQNSWKHGSFKR
jgi:hypothetical protein